MRGVHSMGTLRNIRGAKPTSLVSVVGVVALSLLGLVALPGTVGASSVSVTSTAALEGSYGLRVTLDSPGCAAGTLVVPPGSVSSSQSYVGCEDLVADDVVVTGSGDLDLAAGGTISLHAGFRVDAGGSLTVRSDPSLLADVYVEQDLPVLRDEVAARFRLDVDQASFAADAEVDLLVGLDPNGRIAFAVSVWFRPSLGQARLFVRGVNNVGPPVDSRSSSVLLSAGSHVVDVVWKAGDVGAGNGEVALWLDGVSRTGLTGLGNHSLDVESLRFGSLGVDVAVSGHLDLDDLVAHSEGPVGPVQP